MVTRRHSGESAGRWATRDNQVSSIRSPILTYRSNAYGERDLRRIVAHLDPAAILTLVEFKEAQPARVAARVVDERGGPVDRCHRPDRVIKELMVLPSIPDRLVT